MRRRFGQQNSTQAVIRELEKFMRMTSPKEAERKVREMLNSGAMSKETFESLKNRANGLMDFLNAIRR
jgi:hypothetical protein